MSITPATAVNNNNVNQLKPLDLFFDSVSDGVVDLLGQGKGLSGLFFRRVDPTRLDSEETKRRSSSPRHGGIAIRANCLTRRIAGR